MARYSSAYSDLIRSMEEIESILTLAREVDGQRPRPRDHLTRTNVLSRAGIVLLCSHLEGYIEALGRIAVVQLAERSIPKNSIARKFRYYFSRDIINEIKNTSDKEGLALKIENLVRRDIHIWDGSAHFSQPLLVEMFVGNFATPDHSNIKGFFGRFGFENFEGELGSRLKSNFRPCVNMVNQMVDQRNKIAHGESLTLGAPSDLQDMYSLVKLYCRHTDEVVGNWFSSKGCPIR